VDGEAPPEDAEERRKKRIKLIALGGAIAASLLVIILFIVFVQKSARNKEREYADFVLGMVALKWEIEGQVVKECEAAFDRLRLPENQKFFNKFPEDEAGQDRFFRLWVYVKNRSQDIMTKINDLLKFSDQQTNQLLFSQVVGGSGLEVQDYALDWLTVRGYRILENLKKNPGLAGGATPSAAEGAKVEFKDLGIRRLSMFGAKIEAEFVPGESYFNLDGGYLKVAIRTNYAQLYNPGATSTIIKVSARRGQGQKYSLSFAEEIVDHAKHPTLWALNRWREKSGSK